MHSWQQRDKQIIVFCGGKNWDHHYYHAHFYFSSKFCTFFLWCSFSKHMESILIFLLLSNIYHFFISWQYVWVHFMICILRLMFNLNIFCKNCKKKKISILFLIILFFFSSLFFKKCYMLYFSPHILLIFTDNVVC